MTDHDPLCPFKAWSPDEPWAERKCLCEHNARVRADEVERLRAEVEAYFADAYSKARYRHANDPDHRHYWEGYRDALDIAEQAVLALLGGESDE